MLRFIRHATIAAAAAATFSVSPAAASDQPSTIRIETRPFYGAVITREAGVRVYRPLPPTSKVIINPHGRTPLSLNIEEHRHTSHNHYHNAPAAPAEQPAHGVAGGYLSPYHVGGYHGHGHHGHRKLDGHGKPHGVIKHAPGHSTKKH